MAADISQIVLPDLQPVQDLLWQGLRTAALIAIATLIAVQLIKVPIRFFFHWVMTERWLSRRKSKAKQFRSEKGQLPDWLKAALPYELRPKEEALRPKEEAAPADATTPTSRDRSPDVVGWMPFVPMALYLKKIQNVAERALEHPVQEEANFAYFAADAAVPDMVVTYRVDDIAQRDPKFLEQLTERGDVPSPAGAPSKSDASVAAAIASAQDNVSTSIERSLDDLQIRLTFWWPIFIRVIVFFVAIIIASNLISILARGQQPAAPVERTTMILIGAAAGYLASFAYDLLTLLAAFRPRTQ